MQGGELGQGEMQQDVEEAMDFWRRAQGRLGADKVGGAKATGAVRCRFAIFG